jgi:pimeloyl-ACP methyl ester carboxylesterase
LAVVAASVNLEYRAFCAPPVDVFREEVDAVRSQLGLDRIYLLGTSWGGQGHEWTVTSSNQRIHARSRNALSRGAAGFARRVNRNGKLKRREVIMARAKRGRASRREWGREDSNLRRLSRRVYSPFPLATRAHPREKAIVAAVFEDPWRRAGLCPVRSVALIDVDRQKVIMAAKRPDFLA